MPLLNQKTLQDLDDCIASTNADTIPRYIFQTWRSHEVSPLVYERVQKMQQDNPDWHYCFFSDEMCREFIKKHFDSDVLAAYDILIPGAYKADLWRYCVLYHYGGVYMDIKMTALVSLDDIVINQPGFMVARDIEESFRAGNFYCYNAFMCSQKKHPILKLALIQVINNVKNGYYGTDPLVPTGPGLLGEPINLFLGKPPESTLLPGTYSSEKDGHIEILPIINVQQNIIEDETGKNIIDLGYGSVQDSLSKHTSYWQKMNACYGALWRTGRIYKHKKYQLSLIKKLELKLNLVGLYIDCWFQSFKLGLKKAIFSMNCFNKNRPQQKIK